MVGFECRWYGCGGVGCYCLGFCVRVRCRELCSFFSIFGGGVFILFGFFCFLVGKIKVLVVLVRFGLGYESVCYE